MDELQSLPVSALTEDAASLPAQLTADMSAGEMLRSAREAAGLHIAALAVALKVPVKKLEALEANRFDVLPDAVFVRALASSVCRSLKIDPQPVLSKLPQGHSPRLTYEKTATHTAYPSSNRSVSSLGVGRLSRPVQWAVALLMLGSLVLLLTPPLEELQQHLQEASKWVSNGVSEWRGEPPASGTLKVSEKISESAPRLILTASQPTATAASSADFAAAAAPPARSLSAAVPALPSDAAVAASTATAALGLVTFQARGESWVNVVDKRGAVVLQRTLIAGESAGATGALPLVVVVGRADVTDVQVRGKALDMQPLMKDNVARFEVR